MYVLVSLETKIGTHNDVVDECKKLLKDLSQDIEHLSPQVAQNTLQEIRFLKEYIISHIYANLIVLADESPCQSVSRQTEKR
jgi:CII-binding regulator of phage lambda lysogenization HflD